MSKVKAIVQEGFLTLHERTDLPEGTVIEIDLDDYADHDLSQLDSSDRAKLNAAIAQGRAQGRAGLGIPADDFLDELERA